MEPKKMNTVLLVVLGLIAVALVACDKEIQTVRLEAPLDACENARDYQYVKYYYIDAPAPEFFPEPSEALTYHFEYFPDKGIKPRKHEFHCFHLIIDKKEIARTSEIQDDGSVEFDFHSLLEKGTHEVAILGAIYSRSGN